MIRTAFGAALVALFCAPAFAEDKKPADDKKPTVSLMGNLFDRDLIDKVPAGKVIVSQKAWDELVKAWGIKGAPKVDFEKELLIVGVTTLSLLNIKGEVDDKGDLKITSTGNFAARPGFRYLIESFPRAGVKTINGKELPKE